MKRSVALSLLLAMGFGFSGCVTEPLEEEPTVYGRVYAPAKVKAKRRKPGPIVNEIQETRS
jgi:hypothetical protein